MQRGEVFLACNTLRFLDVRLVSAGYLAPNDVREAGVAHAQYVGSKLAHSGKLSTGLQAPASHNMNPGRGADRT